MANPGPHLPVSAEHPHHSLAVRGSLGSLPFDFQATFSAPWTVLFGPSGCGKSTLLRCLCGVASGLSVQCSRWDPRIEDWLALQDDRTSIPPQHRHMAYAPQQAGLFPHLNVTENIGFARAVRRTPHTSAASLAELLELLALEPLASRLPAQLSGGERQRVSLARALAVPDARLILLDEPFTGVDRTLRDELLPRVHAYLAQRQIPALSVTHDVDEAFLLGAEVIRLHEGRNMAQGPASTILAAEAAKTVQLLTRGSPADLPAKHH